jgi:adenylate cyclase
VRLAAAEDTPKSAAVDGASVLPLPDKPSIAVLPFANMSGDPEQELSGISAYETEGAG